MKTTLIARYACTSMLLFAGLSVFGQAVSESKPPKESRPPETSESLTGFVQTENDGIRYSGNTGFKLYDDDNYNRYMFTNNGVLVNWGKDNLNTFNIGVNGDGDMEFMTGGTSYGTSETKVIFKDNGNVGIGTLDPVWPLHLGSISTISNSTSGAMGIGSADGSHLNFDGNEINAWNGEAAGTLYFNYWSGGDVRIGKSGNGTDLTVYNYTQMGESAPLVKEVLFTGTTDNVSSINFPHNLNADKIVSISAIILGEYGLYIPPNANLSAQYQYSIYANPNNIYITNLGASVQGRAYKVLIKYTK
ncbi:hypothetical protein LAG90_17285 [Marinilongibacter aquaticus]|uniref:hypothetical protein n=1 Tax=Marinilongibacter aquaticus TaxID=2975157 RepID=UPI0021BD94F5|nr:hypothetical protein [Marinilongibacter aquaticus]UBM58559.1 hypothetical protein LAG90_17285 [Marinilongibacter aquaticus]